jgi:hypothetical protein
MIGDAMAWKRARAAVAIPKGMAITVGEATEVNLARWYKLEGAAEGIPAMDVAERTLAADMDDSRNGVVDRGGGNAEIDVDGNSAGVNIAGGNRAVDVTGGTVAVDMFRGIAVAGMSRGTAAVDVGGGTAAVVEPSGTSTINES